jgi:hypothetical protein
MAACAPQRFLANNRNAIREATLNPSSVLPIEDAVLAIPTARGGTAQIALTGSYDGEEEATYDIEIVDDTVATPLISAPVFTGEGSGTLDNISADAIAQEITVELSESGLPLLAAEIDFEGVTVKARTAGAVGNAIYFNVDQSPLTFTPQPYSLIHDLEAGAGGKDNPLTGAEYDFDTKILGADNAIPADAHRIAFGDDTSAIYLQYKIYADGKWQYYFVPELKRSVTKGTVISFVTGGRTVTVNPGSPPETYTGIVTLYDLLFKLQTESQLVMVDGVVANDRSPEGQAAHELQTRTDAYFEPSEGDGSDAARGFVDVSVDPDASTQLVIATCRAVTPKDHPLASVGRERWELKSSLLGELGTIVTNEPYSGSAFGLTIPLRLPFAIDVQVGNFTVTDIVYETRVDPAVPPPICPGIGQRAGLLGPAAVDQTLTLVYTKRPSGDCVCDAMPTQNLDTSCLGNTGLSGETAMAFEEDTRARIEALRIWYTGRVRANSSIGGSGLIYSAEDPFIAAPVADPTSSYGGLLSLKEVVRLFVDTILLMDPLTAGSPSLRGNGMLAWDDAVSELQGDVAAWDGVNLQSFPSDRYEARLGAVLAAAGLDSLGGASASTESGDGCWRDWGGDYWTVVGSEGGAYAPAFTNHPCWLSRRADNTNTYYSTHEAAFQINVKCPEDLIYGDTITMSINGGGHPSTYQAGDTLTLAIIGARDLYVAGGQYPSLVQSWLVNGSVSGPFPPYSFDPDAPAPYSTGSPTSLEFLLNPGGIPFAKGDRFAFSVEGGHYRWRKDAGAWSSTLAIPNGSTVFDAGLSVEFTPGAAPSFAADDVFSFRALQPWAVSNLREPTVEPWKWSGATPTLVIPLGAPTPMDIVALWHTLPVGATITVEGGTTPGVYDWLETLTWRESLIAHVLPSTLSPSYLRLSLTGASGASIMWLWAGEAFKTSKSADVTPHRKYSFTRGDGGLNVRGRFLGKGRGADVIWTEAALTDADMIGLAENLDWVKENDDEPQIFVPQVTRPEEAMLVQVTDDEIEEHDLGDGNRDVSVPRLFDVRLSLGAVLQ